MAAFGLLTLLMSAGSPLAHAAPEGLVVPMPYRSQLDGSPYGPANCGPTSLGMALEWFGVSVSSWDLRVAAMKAQGSWGADYRHEWGVFIHHLAEVAEQHGLRASGLYTREGLKVDGVRSWTADDLRNQLAQGRLVIPQLKFRAMPGRHGSAFRGDHYVVLHGFQGSDFIYSDPMPREGGGPNLRISESALLAAMEQSSNPRAAFAIWR